MAEEEALPDHLRCNRTDGRTWRCKRRVMENLKLCDIHYLQGRHRQYKEKVPESLKMQRKSKKSPSGDPDGLHNVGIRALKVGTITKLKKRKRSIAVSERLNEALKKMKSRKGNMQLDLIRMVLKREVEKIRKKKMKKKKIQCKKNDTELKENIDGELMRELPYGRMSISPAPSPRHSGKAGSSGDDTIGAELVMQRRRFRSKNVEPLSISKLQIVPYGQSLRKLRKSKGKKCHYCQRSSSLSLTECSTCKNEFFCPDCIKERYFDTQEQVKEECPVCRRSCNCSDCLVNQSNDSQSKGFLSDRSEAEKILRFHYLICMVLPILKEMNKRKSDEVEAEAMIRGIKPSEVLIKQVDSSCNEQYSCNKCKASIVDLCRSCPSCSYNLCLCCFQDFSQGCSPRGAVNASIFNWKKNHVFGKKKQLTKLEKTHNSKKTSAFPPSDYDQEIALHGVGGLSCPSADYGGCGGDILLDLKCVSPLNWTEELEASAEEIVCSYDYPESLDMSFCTLCLGKDNKADEASHSQEVAIRTDSNDNYLYYPRLLDIYDDNLDHFQRHWVKGHPVIVRSVLQISDTRWDPTVMFCTYLERTIARLECDFANVSNCLDWCEVEIGLRQSFVGSLREPKQTSSLNETLKLRGWLSSDLFQEQFPAHYSEIINNLPLQDYMHPSSGLLNLAAKLPEEIVNPDLGPMVYLSYGNADEQLWTNSVAKLAYDPCDVVDILAYSTDDPISLEQLTNIIKLLQRQKELIDSSTITDKMPENKVDSDLSLDGQNTEGPKSHSMTREPAHFSRRFSTSSRCFIGPRDKPFVEAKNARVLGKRDLNSRPVVGCCAAKNSNETARDQAKNGKSSEADEKKSLPKSCAHWDVFRRQDVPKLMEYLARHSDEFDHASDLPNHVIHSILDKSFYLDTIHMMRLKEEFEIEPWSFEQHVGEAVIVPTGCPYQIANPKSSVHVVLDFLSPENVGESIKVIDEERLIPNGNRSKVDKLEVRKRALHSISEAIKEIRELTSAMQVLN